MCGISLSASRDRVVDYLHPHWEDSSVIVYKKHSIHLFFVQPFSANVWYAVLALPAVVAMVIYSVNVLGNRLGTNHEPMSSQGSNVAVSKMREEYRCCSNIHLTTISGIDIESGLSSGPNRCTSHQESFSHICRCVCHIGLAFSPAASLECAGSKFRYSCDCECVCDRRDMLYRQQVASVLDSSSWDRNEKSVSFKSRHRHQQLIKEYTNITILSYGCSLQQGMK